MRRTLQNLLLYRSPRLLRLDFQPFWESGLTSSWGEERGLTYGWISSLKTALRSIKIINCSLTCMPNYKIPICLFPFSMTTLLQLDVYSSGTIFQNTLEGPGTSIHIVKITSYQKK